MVIEMECNKKECHYWDIRCNTKCCNLTGKSFSIMGFCPLNKLKENIWKKLIGIE